MASTSIPRGNVFTGVRARFKLNNQTVGYATSVSGSESVQYEAVEVLDNIQVAEHVPVGYYVSCQASRVRLFYGTAGSLKGDLKAFASTDGDPETHLTNILNLPADMTCAIEDSRNATGKPFMVLNNVKITSHNFVVTARGIVGEDITFVGTRMYDEVDTP